ncbi:hypothetical protein BUALT_Bualt02G0073300 [Buddleja alternifolia]|uniref:DUF4283 domain-containing protein n=1 Tax=Buddleja alternifolia TaxID=168488 RepID=A0AAV6Y8U6_9LAMI|nr:hypothetical protein BUALT_Bualt02G0073300 [Buddleja alternifolia]
MSLNVGNLDLTLQNINGPANVFTIVGKVLSNKKINSGAVKSTLLKGWNAKNHVDVNLVEDDKFVFVFQDKEDFSKVINQSPWSFRGNLFVLNHWPPEKVLGQVNLDHACFWIQVSNIPVMFINQENIRLIGNTVGSFIMSDLTSENQRWKKSIRIRVTIDLRKPLVDSVTFNPKPGVSINAEIRYERLADFCYICGLLGHKLSACTSSIHPSNVPSEKLSSFPFGPWLKTENNLSFKTPSQSSSSTSPAMKTLQPSPFETLKKDMEITLIPRVKSLTKVLQTQQPLLSPLPAQVFSILTDTTQCMALALNAQSKNVSSGNTLAISEVGLPICKSPKKSEPKNTTYLSIAKPFQSSLGPSSFTSPSKYVIPSKRPPLKPMFKETSSFQSTKRPLSDLTYFEPKKKSKQPIPSDYMDDLTLMLYNLELENSQPQSPCDNPSAHLFNIPGEVIHSLVFTQNFDHVDPRVIELESSSLMVTEKRVTKWKRLARVKKIITLLSDDDSSDSGKPQKISSHSFPGPEGSQE